MGVVEQHHTTKFHSRHLTSIATTGLSGTLTEKILAVAEAGFEGIEIFENDLVQYNGRPNDIRKLCDSVGLKITMYQPFRDFEGTGEVAKSLARLEQKFTIMKELDTDLILICSNVNPKSSGDRAAAIADLAQAAQLAQKWNMRIAYEALGWGAHVNRWSQSWEIVQAVNHPSLGLCLDTFHIYSTGDDANGLEDVPGDKVFIIQFADAPLMKMDTLQYSRHYRNYPFQGQYPIPDFTQRLLRTGYKGPYSLEIFNDDFRAAPALSTAKDGLRSILLLQETIYEDVIPAIPAIGGIRFVEFAVDTASLSALTLFLRDLNFVKAGVHKTKNVTLFGNGSTYFILNCESESFASSFFLHHGVSICAICIEVDSVRAMVSRAQAMNYEIVSQDRRADDELEMPAILAPDESLIYLTEPSQMWLHDFELSPASTPNGASPNRQEYSLVDHVAQALDRLQMDKFVLFYRAMLGMEAAQTFELNDPYGLVKSRAMVSRNGALRFPLNISEQGQTVIGRFVSQYRGSGVHHVALATDDIFSTVRKIGLSEVAALQKIPDNYYDDLALRFDLPLDLITKLKVGGILYDRDQSGEFFHASTNQFCDRFFFEIVQRVGKYDQFGSINAALRMTIHHEQRSLRQSVGAAITGPQRSVNKIKSQMQESQTSIVVLYDSQSNQIAPLVAKILGVPLSTLSAGSLDSFVVQNSEVQKAVVGISWEEALELKKQLVARPRNLIMLNTICVDDHDEHEDGDWISAESDFEYLYSMRPFLKRDLARFMTFVLGEHNPMDAIHHKQTTNFIAITYPDVRVALQNLDILTLGADAIELRVDFLREPIGDGKYSSIPSLKYVGQQVMALRQRTELPIIFTLRSVNEGGRWPLEANGESHHYLRKALSWGCEIVDVEVRLSEDIKSDIYAKKGNSTIISSYHDLSGRMKWSSTDVQLKYHTARQSGDIVKLIGFANSLSDNYELEYFRTSMTSTFSTPLLAINAGQNGQLSRVLNTFLSPTTHPLLPVAAAPGQLSAAEINGALHILGQLPSKKVYSIGNFTAAPLNKFYDKFFNELGLPHSFQTIDRVSANLVETLVRQKDFGGANLNPPLGGQPTFISSLTESARDIGQVDTVYSRASGNESTIIGDSIAWRGIRRALTSELVPSAFSGQSALVVATTEAEALSAIYALKALDCKTIYTIGFECTRFEGTEQISSPDKIQLSRAIAVISVLASDRSHSLLPIIKMASPESGSLDRKPILLDLANGPKRGDPLAVAAANGWRAHGLGDVFAFITMESMKALVSQNAGYDFCRMATGRGNF